MTRINRTLWIAALTPPCAPVALGHHNTGALFDLDAEVSIEGVVTAYDWANPHVYFGVQTGTDDGPVWEIEAGALAIMRRAGWTENTLQAGDRVTVTANPSRQAAKSEGYLVAATKGDVSLPNLRGAAIVEALSARSGPATEGAQSLSGTWATLLNLPLAERRQEADKLPLTQRGRDAAADFDEQTMSPALECIPYTAPLAMIISDTKSIEIRDDIALIRGEFDAVERTVYLSAPTADVGSALQGVSVGRFEGTALVVETNDFAAHRSGNGFGVPSGSRKRLRERFDLHANGRTLTYSFMLIDPEYLAVPVTGAVEWEYRPDLEYAALACDRDNARRFVDE